MQTDPQTVYDCVFMSEPEFVSIYSEILSRYSDSELKRIYIDVRGSITGYSRNLTKTKRKRDEKPSKRNSRRSNR